MKWYQKLILKFILMKAIKKLFDYINGNKTLICSIAVIILQSNIIPISAELTDVLFKVFLTLGGGALAHKFQKKIKNR